MSDRIKPTIGQAVWFFKHHPGQGHREPLAAQVCHVTPELTVNLMVIDQDGNPRPEKNIPLVQHEGGLPDGDYCTFLPHQGGNTANVPHAEKTKTHEAKPKHLTR